MPASSSLTRWALGAAAVTAVAVGAAWAASGGGIFSPGGLRAGREEARTVGGVASHAELARRCGACHAPPWGAERMADRCLDCHTAVRAELGDTTALHGIVPEGERCLLCHTEHGGPLANLTEFDGEGFDHARLGFSLAVHRRTSGGRPFTCSDCHGGGTFRFAAERCEECHREYQAELMAAHVRAWGGGCMACHEGTDRFTAFAHDTTRFRLTGAHVRTECAACHREVRTFAAFAGAPETCIGCHRADDAHRGEYGSDCAACHSTTRWDEADFEHTFPLDHGGEGRVACRTCHEQMPRFTAYTCYGCHEHTPAEIREEHLDEGIRDFRNCVECHPTGREGEAERRGDRGRDREREGGGRRRRGGG